MAYAKAKAPLTLAFEEKLSDNITLLQLDEDLEMIPDKDITRDRNIAIGGLVLEGDLGLNAENKGRVGIQGLFGCQPLGQSLRKVAVSNTSDCWTE